MQRHAPIMRRATGKTSPHSTHSKRSTLSRSASRAARCAAKASARSSSARSFPMSARSATFVLRQFGLTSSLPQGAKQAPNTRT
jgi:hypothetical protein